MFPNSLHSMQGRGFAPDHFAYLYQQEAQKILNSDFNQQGLNTSLLAQTGTVYQEADKMPQTFNFDSHCHMAEVKDSNYCHQQPLATAGESLRFDGCDMRCGSASLITSKRNAYGGVMYNNNSTHSFFLLRNMPPVYCICSLLYLHID